MQPGSFHLGAFRYWLGREGLEEVPLFVSHRQLNRGNRKKKANQPWALDSGGFTELSKHGEWKTGPEEYVEAVYRYRENIGRLAFASPQDWMCEPWMLHGRTVEDHQRRTVENYLRLKELAPDIPFIPVLQGWDIYDYENCIALYSSYGVNLRSAPLVGVGSVCRRQYTAEIGEIMTLLHACGLRLHGFGVKTEGLAKYHDKLVSADSFAWSYAGRKREKLPECTHPGKCNNCPTFALKWRANLLRKLGHHG